MRLFKLVQPKSDQKRTITRFHTRRSVFSYQKMAQPASFSIESLNQQIRSTVVRVLYHSCSDSQRQVVVRGTIAEIPATQYRICYRVPLKDGTEIFYMDVGRELLARRGIERGDYVEVIGILTVDDGQSQSSRVDIRLAASDLRQITRPQEAMRDEQATLDYLRGVKRMSYPFPEIGTILISLIHPVSERALVHEDFRLQTGRSALSM
jgi:hypothetical protein